MRVKTDGGTLDVADDGGSGPPLLLLHACALDKKIWHELVPRLTPATRVVRCDLRGFGASSSPPGPYLIEAIAGDLLDVADALGIEQTIVAGHGDSVAVALTFYRMFAERVCALGAIGGSVKAPDQRARAEFNALADAVEREGLGPLTAAWLPSMLAPQTVLASPALAGEVRATMLGGDACGVAANLRGMALRDGFEDLYADLAIPVAVIASEADPFGSVDDARDFAAALSNAEFAVVPGGHIPQLEAPRELAAALARLAERARSRV